MPEERLFDLASRIAALLPGLVENPKDRIDLLVAGNQLARLLGILDAAPVRSEGDAERSHALIRRSLSMLGREVRRFEVACIAMLGDAEPFDDEAYARQLREKSLEELEKLLDDMAGRDGGEASDLDALIAALDDGEMNVAAARRDLIRIKQIILILAEILARLKLPEAIAEKIAKLLAKLAKKIDRIAGGGALAGDGGGGGTASGTGTAAKTCLMYLDLLKITATDLANTGNEWRITIRIDGGQAVELQGQNPSESFDRSKNPAEFVFKTRRTKKGTTRREPNPTWAWTEEGCGTGRFEITVEAVQYGGGNDSASNTFPVDYTCGEKKKVPISLDVHDNGNVNKPKSVLAFEFELTTSCSS